MSDGRQVFSNGKDFSANIGNDTLTIVELILQLDKKNVIDRMWKKDHTVWRDNPAEIANRLGWLKSPEVMAESLQEINQFVADIKESGYKQVLLLGMGGSSLAPEVFRYTFGVKDGFLDLSILDSTDPGAVLEKERELNPEDSLFIVSTKSGGTVETLSFMKYFYNRVLKQLGAEEAGKHFVAITDPGSGLEKMAKELNFRKIFLNDPDIGGRYSALSFFGLVPAALIGVDIARILEEARKIADSSHDSVLLEVGQNSGAWMGAILGGLAKEVKDRLTLISSPSLKYFGAWIEQLIAESTGKEGKGILPVDGESVDKPDSYLKNRVFIYTKLKGEDGLDKEVRKIEVSGQPLVRITLDSIYDLGREFFRWEVATAVACEILDINPFDQPDVESAKVRAREMMVEYQEKGHLPDLPVTISIDGLTIYSTEDGDSLSVILNKFFKPLLGPSGSKNKDYYISIQAYLKPSKETNEILDYFRTVLRRQFGAVVTVGYGPRFLHSTGQLHKGDKGKGLSIQLLSEIEEDAQIPADPVAENSLITFGVLKKAQALGDRQALIDAGRKVITIDLGSDIEMGVHILRQALV